MEEQKVPESILHKPSDEDLYDNLKMLQFSDKQIEQEWSCPICMMVVYDPVSCKNCDPLYCRRCILRNLNNKCPTCNQESDFRPANLKLKNMLMKITIDGCPHCLCSKHQIQQTYEELLQHLKSECKDLIMNCPRGCQTKVNKSQMGEHFEICPLAHQQYITPVGEILSSKDKYWWSEQTFKLPIEISFDVKCTSKNGEVLPIFSQEKRQWSGATSPIALSLYLSPHRADFTFRTKIFGGFPASQKHAGPIIMQVDRFYHIACRIYHDTAEYSVDGVKYASCSLKPGDVPSEGYFGMGNYGENHSLFKDLKIKNIMQ